MSLFLRQRQVAPGKRECAGRVPLCLPDIYLSANIEWLMAENPRVSEVLTRLIRRFSEGDYGDIPEDEREANDQTRNLSGSCRWMTARYDTDLGRIALETFFDMGMFYFADEDLSEIRNAQDELQERWLQEQWR